jgi:hypothetical protein
MAKLRVSQSPPDLPAGGASHGLARAAPLHVAKDGTCLPSYSPKRWTLHRTSTRWNGGEHLLKTVSILMVIGFAIAAAAQKQSLQTWNATEGTFALDEQVKRGSKASIRLHNATADLRSGVMHAIELNQSKPVPCGFRHGAKRRMSPAVQMRAIRCISTCDTPTALPNGV